MYCDVTTMFNENAAYNAHLQQKGWGDIYI